MHFEITEKTTKDCVLLYNNVALVSEISNERSQHLRFREPRCHSRLYLWNPCKYSHKPYIARKKKSLIYILPLTVWVYLHSNFSGGLSKTIFFHKSAFRPFKSSKVVNFDSNRKRVCCDFLLVPHSNLGARRYCIFLCS